VLVRTRDTIGLGWPRVAVGMGWFRFAGGSFPGTHEGLFIVWATVFIP
jgi:hypothetical protein